MSRRFAASISLVTVLASGSTGPASAQTAPAAPQHKHYDTPAGYDQAPAPGMPLAPRLQNLGVHTFPVSTRDSRAQLFVNQGLNLVYAFNHAESGRAFAEAARLDPSLAMAYWGQALVLGPNINAMMEPNDEPHADELVKKALALAAAATPREQALIKALDARYSGGYLSSSKNPLHTACYDKQNQPFLICVLTLPEQELRRSYW